MIDLLVCLLCKLKHLSISSRKWQVWGFFRLVFSMKKPLGFSAYLFHMIDLFYATGAKICQNDIRIVVAVTESGLWLSGEKLIMWKESNLWAKLEVLIFIPTPPWAPPTQNLPLSCACRPVSKGIVVLWSRWRVWAEHRSHALSQLPLTCLSMTWKKFLDELNELPFATRNRKVESLSMQMTWFYCHEARMASLLSEKTGSGWTVLTSDCHCWQMSSNIELAFIQQPVNCIHSSSHWGLHFPTQPFAGLTRRRYLLNIRCLGVQS